MKSEEIPIFFKLPLFSVMHCCEHLEKARQGGELLLCLEHRQASESGAAAFRLGQGKPKPRTLNKSKLPSVRERVPGREPLAARLFVGTGWAKAVIYGRSQDFKGKRKTALAKGAGVSQAEGHAFRAGGICPKRDLPLLPPHLPPLKRTPRVCYSPA